MNKTIFTILAILICSLSRADIAPNPVQAKGISINLPTEIKMTYERVVIDLTKDSSFVHCYFRLHNTGKAQKIQIGYPNMGYYSFNSAQGKQDLNPIFVQENGIKTENIDSYIPDTITLNNSSLKYKPWYLWDTYFKEGETKIITLSYSLPKGRVKGDQYSTFNNLLSTGAGWKDKIDTAEIIINLKNIDKELILAISPDKYTKSGNQILWNFFDLEPTTQDDILIKYEMFKGQYEEYLKKNPPPSYLLDNKVLLSNKQSDANSFSKLKVDEIASIQIMKKISEDLKKRFPSLNDAGGLILVFTKDFALNKLSELLRSESRGLAKKFKSGSVSDFEENYVLNLNGIYIEKTNMLREIADLEEKKVTDISIKDSGNTKKEISIKTDR